MEGSTEKKWYVIKVHSGFEVPVTASIAQAIESLGLQDQIFEVFIPIEKRASIKKGKRVEKEERIFPGYILVNMILNDQTWYAINNIEYISGFLGSRSKAESLSDEEVEAIKDRINITQSNRPKSDIKIGSIVRITEGPFQNLDGRISELDTQRGEVTVLVSMFGRDTPVKLEFFQIKQL